ncbi:hypothetical protein BJX99DRAFT_253202 [Aspergillus californicus]
MARYTVIADEEVHNDRAKEPPSSTAILRLSNWLPPIASFLLGVILTSILFLSSTFTKSDTNTCTRTLSTWSPALEALTDTDLTTTRFDGALRASHNRFRGAPSPDLDEAWDEITYADGGLVRLQRDELDRINASEFAAEYTEDLGGGYIAGVEVFHQLHCLNMLRKTTYMEYYLPRMGEWRDRGVLRYHLVSTQLMCNPDVGMITYVWAKGWKQAFPDFSTVHKCRPYDKVLDWARENYVHSSRDVADIERAPGAMERDERP